MKTEQAAAALEKRESTQKKCMNEHQNRQKENEEK
jgi:hypothetical protein